MPHDLPSYRDLPVRADAPPHSAWGLWGDADASGSINLADSERARAGAAEVLRGAVFSLNLPLDLPDPPFGTRRAMEHRIISLEGGLGNDDEYNNFNVQAGSQLDGFGHVRHPVHGYWNGLPLEEQGVHHWARHGIASRGVLLDVARWRAEVGRPLHQGTADVVTSDDLRCTAEAQRTVVEPGDVLLVRTGFLEWYRTLDAAERRAVAADPRMPGLDHGEDVAEYLWDLHPSLVAADNMSLEAWPLSCSLAEVLGSGERATDLFLHTALLPLLGVPVGEFWDLDDLAADCASDGRYTCQVTCAVMDKHQGIASMANALALK